MRGSFERRWITLISAGWLPHFIGTSRGCLALGAGIIPIGDAHIVDSRIPLTVCRASPYRSPVVGVL